MQFIQESLYSGSRTSVSEGHVRSRLKFWFAEDKVEALMERIMLGEVIHTASSYLYLNCPPVELHEVTA